MRSTQKIPPSGNQLTLNIHISAHAKKMSSDFISKWAVSEHFKDADRQGGSGRSLMSELFGEIFCDLSLDYLSAVTINCIYDQRERSEVEESQ